MLAVSKLCSVYSSMTDEWKRIRKWSCPNWYTIATFPGRNEENHKNLSQDSQWLFNIWIKHPLNISLEHYPTPIHLVQSSGCYIRTNTVEKPAASILFPEDEGSTFLQNIVTYQGFAWRIIIGSRFDDWVYWHFFTITVDYNSSHTELLLNVCLSCESLTAL
jgi:hypothetical protein